MKKVDSYSPYAGRNFPTNVYWGDTHLHTGMSMDAGAFGNRLGIDEAYQFARGDEITTSGGMKAGVPRTSSLAVRRSECSAARLMSRSSVPQVLSPLGVEWLW